MVAARWGDMAPRMRAVNKQTSQKGDLGHKRPSVQKRLKSLLWVRLLAAACLLVNTGVESSCMVAACWGDMGPCKQILNKQVSQKGDLLCTGVGASRQETRREEQLGDSGQSPARSRGCQPCRPDFYITSQVHGQVSHI